MAEARHEQSRQTIFTGSMAHALTRQLAYAASSSADVATSAAGQLSSIVSPLIERSLLRSPTIPERHVTSGGRLLTGETTDSGPSVTSYSACDSWSVDAGGGASTSLAPSLTQHADIADPAPTNWGEGGIIVLLLNGQRHMRWDRG
mmetsp:Transcript_15174/g.38055  ORF Transcript_15174/g.38055 Transcript_15174/m.38055 type:complete len:146 (+) Transcript_15174:590-1027(+)